MSDNIIPLSEWGKDHWDTLLYLETRCVDHRGKVRIEQLRTNSHHWALRSLWRQFLENRTDYATRLRDREIDNHDDWDCLLDMEAAGVVEINRAIVTWCGYVDDWFVNVEGHEGDPYLPTGLMEGEREARELAFAVYRLTALGQNLSAQLRAHRQGDLTVTFVPVITETAAA